MWLFYKHLLVALWKERGLLCSFPKASSSRELLKTANGDGLCTLRMNMRGKSFLLVLSLPFSATLEGTHLCKQMAGKFCDAAQQQVVSEAVLGAAVRDEQQ